jgi:hypothetical protein
MSEHDEVFVFGRWRRRTDAVIHVLSERDWSGKRGPKLELSSEPRQGMSGPYVIVARKGTARAEFYGFEDPHAAINAIRKAIE